MTHSSCYCFCKPSKLSLECDRKAKMRVLVLSLQLETQEPLLTVSLLCVTQIPELAIFSPCCAVTAAVRGDSESPEQYELS